jgi:hypothetical protein
LNVHVPTGDKNDDMKDSFYDILGGVFDKFPKYHIKILLGDLNVKVGGHFQTNIWESEFTCN